MTASATPIETAWRMSRLHNRFNAIKVTAVEG